MLKHVEDVEDRSNTPKGCNAMYVEDVEDGKRSHTHTFWLITILEYCQWIDQIHEKSCNAMKARRRRELFQP